MTNESQRTVGEKQKEARSPLYEISRKILLAAIGAAVIAQDEVESFVNRLVEHGEIAEKEARQIGTRGFGETRKVGNENVGWNGNVAREV